MSLVETLAFLFLIKIDANSKPSYNQAKYLDIDLEELY